jgi:pyridoxal phosphate enzyme (YggS family)
VNVDIAANLAGIHERITRAAHDAGRDPDAITLVVVTKTFGVDDIRAALDAGAHDLGENRAQELVDKAPALAGLVPAPRWHFIGRLQRNKVRAVAPYVACWQSVDRHELADEIAHRAPGASVFVQVNVGDELQKGGCAIADAPALVAHAREQGLGVEGLMTVPPAGVDPGPFFRTLRQLADRLGLPGCSMGMSGDFEVAIAEGATVVRVGSAVFGPRPPEPNARR